jgi:hypothetical protein
VTIINLSPGVSTLLEDRLGEIKNMVD